MQSAFTLHGLLSVVIAIGLAGDDKRTWSDASGQFRIVAELVSQDADSVTLRKEDGELVEVPIAQLSLADQEFLKSRSQPQARTTYSENGLQKKISVSFDQPFGVFAPNNSEPLFITLELSGEQARDATAYGQVRLRPIKDDRERTLRPVQSRSAFRDPSKDFVEFDPFSKEDDTVKIYFMVQQPSESASYLSVIEGTVKLQTGPTQVAVPFQFENVPLGGGFKTSLQQPGSHGGFFSFAFTAGGESVIGGTGIIKDSDSGEILGGGEVILWNARTGKQIKTLGKHDASVGWTGCSPDGRTAFSFSQETGVMNVWALPDGRLVKRLQLGTEELERLVVSPDGTTLLIVAKQSTEQGEALFYEGKVVDVASGKVKWTTPLSNSSAVAISPDGNTVAAHIVTVENGRVANQEIQFRSAEDGAVQGSFELGRRSPRDAIAFHPSGMQLIGLAHETILVWDLPDGSLSNELSLTGGESFAKNIQVSFDGQRVALARFMGDAVEVWDLKTGSGGRRSFEFPNTIHHASFSADLRYVACSQQGPVVLELTELEPLQVAPRAHEPGNSRPPSVAASTRPPSVASSTRPQPESKEPAATYRLDASNKDLNVKASFSASTRIGTLAFDGDDSTRWVSKKGDHSRAWLATRWDKPVEVHQIVVREAFNRITDFVIERFDEPKNDWVPMMNVFGRRRVSSFSAEGEERGWGYFADAVQVNGVRLEDQKDLIIGQDHGEVHPVFIITLPKQITTSGIRLFVKKANTEFNDHVSIFEMEIYGTAD